MRVTTVDDRCRLFISTCFRRVRLFQIFRKRLLGQMLRKSIGRASGGVRGGSGRRLGGSWGSPGGSGGASWEGLGRSWGVLGATFKAVRFRIDFLIDFERQKGAKREAFGEPKWSQNQSQNDSNSKSISKNEKTLFKTVLGAPWGHLDPIWGPVLGHFFEFGSGFAMVS